MELRELLDAATARLGSQRAVAEALGMPDTHLSNVKAGTRPLSIERQARLCELAGWNEGEISRYVWGVVRERMGKVTSGAASGAVALIVSTVAGFALLAAHLGSAPMYRPSRIRAQSGNCQLAPTRS